MRLFMHNISITDLHANFMFLFDQFHFLERTDDEHTNDRGRFYGKRLQ